MGFFFFVELCVIGKGGNRDPISMKECASLLREKVCLFSWLLKDTCSRTFMPTRTEKNNEEFETTELSISFKSETKKQ